MSGTALYRALINGGANEELAKEVDDSERMDKTLTELKILVRLNSAGILIIIGILVKILTVI